MNYISEATQTLFLTQNVCYDSSAFLYLVKNVYLIIYYIQIFVSCVIRFMQDLEDMLGFKPYKFYFYLWKYVSPACLIVLITASVIEMAINPPGYNAWVQDQVSET